MKKISTRERLADRSLVDPTKRLRNIRGNPIRWCESCQGQVTMKPDGSCSMCGGEKVGEYARRAEIIRQSETKEALLPIGTEVYYTGDMANQPGRGRVKAHRLSAFGESMDLEIEGAGAREFLGLTMAHFSPGPGRRFWTLEEWRADRKAKIEAMEFVRYLLEQKP